MIKRINWSKPKSIVFPPFLSLPVSLCLPFLTLISLSRCNYPSRGSGINQVMHCIIILSSLFAPLSYSWHAIKHKCLCYVTVCVCVECSYCCLWVPFCMLHNNLSLAVTMYFCVSAKKQKPCSRYCPVKQKILGCLGPFMISCVCVLTCTCVRVCVKAKEKARISRKEWLWPETIPPGSMSISEVE